MIKVKFETTSELRRYVEIKNPTKKGELALYNQAMIIARKLNIDVAKPFHVIYVDEPSDVQLKKSTKDGLRDNQIHLFN